MYYGEFENRECLPLAIPEPFVYKKGSDYWPRESWGNFPAASLLTIVLKLFFRTGKLATQAGLLATHSLCS